VGEGDSETDAGLELALLHLQMNRAEAAIRILQEKVIASAKGERVSKAQRLLAHAYWKAGRKKEAIVLLTRILEQTEEPKHRREILLTLAEFQAEARGPAAGAAVIGQEKLNLVDVENETVLRALAGFLVDSGTPEAALESVDAAIAENPEHAPYYDLRARVLARLERNDEAAAAFARALELDPSLASALAGQAALAQMQGDDARAVELFDAAAAADEDNAEYAYLAAQIELGQGHIDAAAERLNAVLRRQPTHAHANNDLAWILAERNQDLDRALALATMARTVESSATILDTLGWVQLARDEATDAVVTLEEAHALEPDSPSIAYRLGLALARVGEADRAKTLLEEALATGPFPESAAAKSQLAQLEADQG
jgi:tetratricopeptide (TPR) repeat protein